MKDLPLGIVDLSLRHLKAAAVVAECQNVTRAAEGLNRSQTAITKAIADLESALEVSLFDRSSIGVTPTVFGEALAKRINNAAAEFVAAGQAYDQLIKPKRNFRNIALFSMEVSYKRLAAFVALFESRDVGAAAQRLGITNAAVHNSIRQLEGLIELQLFERHPSGVMATPYCEVLARHVNLAFAEIRHAVDDIASLSGVISGKLCIGTLPYTRTILNPRAVHRLLSKHPGLKVSTREGTYAQLEAGLRSGNLDFVIGATRPPDRTKGLVTEALLKDRLAVIARKDHPLAARRKISIATITDLDWILPARQTPARQLFDQFLEKNEIAYPRLRVETQSLAMVRGLLLESDRVALLSEHQIYFDLKFGLLTVLPIDLGETYRPIGVTMRAQSEPSPAARLFLQELRATAAELTNKESGDSCMTA